MNAPTMHETCPICGHGGLVVLEVASHLRYDVCGNCGVCIKHVESASAQEDFASSQNAYYEETIEDPFAEPSAIMRERLAHRARVLQRFIKPGSSVLEIGPGGGQVADWLLRNNCDYLGCEISKELTKRLKARGIPVVNNDFEMLPSVDAFDLVLSFHTIEHVPEPQSQLTKAFSIVKPGGFFIIATPNARSWEQRLFSRLSANFDVGHLHVFSPRSLVMMAEAAGWQVHASSTSEYTSDWLRILSKVLRRFRNEDEVASAGKYSRMAASGGADRAISLISAVTAPLRLVQASLGGGNEIVLVLQRPNAR